MFSLWACHIFDAMGKMLSYVEKVNCPSGHIDWIDRWRGMLIVLVVAGHVFGGACHLCDGLNSQAFSLIYKTIYIFHMPAFFLLAGVCWKQKKSDFLSFVKQKARRLLVPYFIFGLFSAILYVFIIRGDNLFHAAKDGYYVNMEPRSIWQPFISLLIGNAWPDGQGFRCNSVLWFLPAMFSVLCFYWCVDYFLKRRSWQLLLACFLFILDFVNRKFWGLSLPFGMSNITWYCPFVIFGRWSSTQLKSLHFKSCYQTYTHLIVFCFLYILLAWGEFLYYWGQISVIWYPVNLLMAIIGAFFSAVVANLIPWKWLVLFGKSSLGIMLTHKFAVLFFQVKLPFVSILADYSPALFWGANLLVLASSLILSGGITHYIKKHAPALLGE